MRRSLLLGALALLGLAAPSVLAQTTAQFGTGSFVGLRGAPGSQQLDVVSSTNDFGTVTQNIALTSARPLVAVARRPAGGLFYFIDEAGQLYSGDVDTAIRNMDTTALVLTAVGAADSQRVRVPANNGTGFHFNPVADRIRIVYGDRNFRINPTNAVAGGGMADGNQEGNTITYVTPDGLQTPNLVATAYINQVNPAPTTTSQYGIDAANSNFVFFNSSNLGNISGVALSGLTTPTFTSGTAMTIVTNGANNIVVAVVSDSDSTKRAYTINPQTGAATAITGPINGPAYYGLAFTPAVFQAQPSSSTGGAAASSSTAAAVSSSSSAGTDPVASSSSSTAGNQPATIASLVLRVVFPNDFNALSGNDAAIAFFSTQFVSEVSRALNIASSQIAVNSVEAGSTVVRSTITNAPVNTENLIEALKGDLTFPLLSTATDVEDNDDNNDNAASGLVAPAAMMLALAAAVVAALRA